MSADQPLNPLTMLRDATKAVPVVKYATGLVGIAAAIYLVRGFLGDMSPLDMLPLILGFMACMAVLIVLASSMAPAGNRGMSPGRLLLWAASLFMIIFMILMVTAVAFGWPPQFAKRLPGEAANAPIVDIGLATPAVAAGEDSDAGRTDRNSTESRDRAGTGSTGGGDSASTSGGTDRRDDPSSVGTDVGGSGAGTADSATANADAGVAAPPVERTATAADLLRPDPNADPNYQSIRLEAGFLPDPKVVQLDAGGRLDARVLGDDCRGFVTREPDVRLSYAAGEHPLIISVAAEADTTLVVNDPRGGWHCDDDGGSDRNPVVRFSNPANGQYEIWVGTYSSGGSRPARLLISEEEDE